MISCYFNTNYVHIMRSENFEKTNEYWLTF